MTQPEYHYLDGKQKLLRNQLGWDRVAHFKDKIAEFKRMDDPDSNQTHIAKLVCDQALFLSRFDTTLNDTVKEIWRRYPRLPYHVQIIDGIVKDPEHQPFGYLGPSTVERVREAIRNNGLDNAAYFRTVFKQMGRLISIPVIERDDSRRSFDARQIDDFFNSEVMTEKDDQYTFLESFLEHIAYVRAHVVIPWDEDLERKGCFCRHIKSAESETIV